MSLRFIIGRAGSGKSYLCREEIKNALNQGDPWGQPLIMLCPEQSTFQKEIELINHLKCKSLLRARVVSFERLSWWILNETGGLTKEYINETGIKMMLRKILESKKDTLKIFYGEMGPGGSVDSIFEFISEIKKYKITPGLLNETILKVPEGLLKEKLHEITEIFMSLQEKLDGKMTPDDKMSFVTEKISMSQRFKDSEFWVDGFHVFTPQEYDILLNLMKISRRVNVTLCLPKELINKNLTVDNHFYKIKETMEQLTKLARDNNIIIDDYTTVDGLNSRFSKSKELAHLEKHYFNYPTIKYQKKPENIKINYAATPREEVEFVASQCIKYCRDIGYKWRDIGLLVRDLDTYGDLIKRVFEFFSIPIFIDRKRKVLHHPLVELIRSLLEVGINRWQYEYIFRFLKCDLDKNLSRKDVDLLENYVLEYGILGKKWYDDSIWCFHEKKLNKTKEIDGNFTERINSIKTKAVSHLREFYSKYDTKMTVKEISQNILDLLIKMDVRSQLENWEREEIDKGNLEKAQEHSQIWNGIIDLLDQMVEILGDEVLDLEEYYKVLNSGFEDLKIGLVPQGLDQVNVGDFDRSRVPETKITFILGVNDGILPARQVEEGILTDSEKLLLKEKGQINLGNDTVSAAFEEQFHIYQALTRSREKLHLSYSLSNEEGNPLLPSQVIYRLKEIFPEIEIVEGFSGIDTPEIIVNKAKTLSILSNVLKELKDGKQVGEYWLDVYNWFVENEPDKLYGIISGLFYSNHQDRISREIIDILYGSKIKTSVSKLEKFTYCPFSHFLTTGLKIKERKIHKISAPDFGELFHSAIYNSTKYIETAGMNWADLDKKKCSEIAENIVDNLAPLLQNEILLSTSRHKYILKKIKKTVKTALWLISEHSRYGNYKQLALELPFGPDGDIPSLTFEIEEGVIMEITGRIDRVDLIENKNGKYLRVIDYKSGSSSLSLHEIYFGLKLQLLLYLDVVLTYGHILAGGECLPGGFLYFEIKAPIIAAESPLSEEEVDLELIKKLKMKGMLLKDVDFVKELDIKLEQHSKILPVTLKKDGEFGERSRVYSIEEFKILRNHVRNIILKIGRQILQGVADIAPYKIDNKKACDYCDYISICQFDTLLDSNKFRVLNKEKGNSLLFMTGGDEIEQPMD